MRTLCIDPGEQTGWALFDRTRLVDSGSDAFLPFMQFFSYQIDYVERVVIEDFILLPSKAMQQAGSKVPSAKVIGAIEWHIELSGWKGEVVWHRALQKEFVCAERLKKLGMYTKDSEHARDAIRHGVVDIWLTRREGNMKQLFLEVD